MFTCHHHPSAQTCRAHHLQNNNNNKMKQNPLAFMLPGLSKNIAGFVSDPPKVVHFWRIRCESGSSCGESTQHKLAHM